MDVYRDNRTDLCREEMDRLKSHFDDLKSLIEVTNIISSTLDLEQVLALVMEKAQEVMRAEASSVFLINQETQALECEIALGTHAGQLSKKITLAKGQGIAGWVWQNAQPLIVPDVQRDQRFYGQVDTQSGFVTRSILAVPLIWKDRLIGVAEVINRTDGKEYTEYDLNLFTTFGRQVALAIENARFHQLSLEQERLRQQLESAKEIQQSFMPQKLPQGENGIFDIAARNLPAISVGGDLFDVLMLDDRHVGLLIGDVSGKGVPAALYMARLMSDFRFYVQQCRQPSELLEKLNNTLVDRGRHGMFVTLQFVNIDIWTGRLCYSEAGHLPMMYMKDGNASLFPAAGNPPLGILPELTFAQKEMQLTPGDIILLYTDGIVEAKNNKHLEFGMKRLTTMLSRPWSSAMQIVEDCLKQVYLHMQSAPQHDDITLVSFQWQKAQSMS
ncbi:MAG: GAF domain-containing protein [Calditrichaeota bacterium]|nr:MAG: GAF domain-containing protein [Calditrichota bacterium]